MGEIGVAGRRENSQGAVYMYYFSKHKQPFSLLILLTHVLVSGSMRVINE